MMPVLSIRVLYKVVGLKNGLQFLLISAHGQTETLFVYNSIKTTTRSLRKWPLPHFSYVIQYYIHFMKIEKSIYLSNVSPVLQEKNDGNNYHLIKVLSPVQNSWKWTNLLIGHILQFSWCQNDYIKIETLIIFPVLKVFSFFQLMVGISRYDLAMAHFD